VGYLIALNFKPLSSLFLLMLINIFETGYHVGMASLCNKDVLYQAPVACLKKEI